MIEAAAAENDGTLALQCDMILQGNMFARGDIGTGKIISANRGIYTGGGLDARVVTARARIVATEILAKGDVVTRGRITSMGDAYVHGRIDSYGDITAYADTPDWVTAPQKKIEANP